MQFVLDTSIPACWAFQDEQDARADAAYLRIKTEEAVVPSLWWFEIRNILVVNERRKRITESDTGVFLRDWRPITKWNEGWTGTADFVNCVAVQRISNGS